MHTPVYPLIPAADCLHRMVEAQAARAPQALAVICGEQTLTYEQLDRQSNQVARYLLARGVGAEQIVGICMERSLDMVVAMLAILKAGAAYLPLDPAYPRERLDFMLADARVGVALVGPAAPPLPAQVAAIDLGAIRAATALLDGGPIERRPASLAYVLYTSGSTGRPKGVMVEHRALINHMRWMQRAFGFGPDDRVLQKTPFSFDASVWEFYAPLLSGGLLVLARPGGHQDPQYLARAIQRHHITVLQVVPSLLRMLVAEPEFAACASLRYLCVGGEALGQALIRQTLQQLDVPIYNLYGPTETTIDATAARCAADYAGPAAPIGRPIDNLQAWILDGRMEPVAAGQPGELYLGGAGLARGYIHQPAITASRFVPNPYPAGPAGGERLYRTGDLVRRLENGELEFLGRADHQVKIRGFRIELGEIDAALERDPRIGQAVTVCREDTPGDVRLVAYLTAHAAPPPTPADLRQALGLSLPPHMVPSAFVVLEALPCLPNGKIDRAALPAPAPDTEAAAGPPPPTPAAAVIQGMFQDVLRLPAVGIHADFFALGGHSLLATQLQARIREHFKAECSVATIFAHPTVASLAAHLEASPAASRVQAIAPASRDQPLPLSIMQERVWFLSQLNPQSRAYNFQMTIQFKGHLRLDILERACSEIVRRHEILRTTFPASAGQPYQRIHQPWAVTIPLVDLRDLPEQRRQEQAERMIAARLQEPFDLQRLPLVRWFAFQLADDDYVLLQIEHHFIHDGWSIALLLSEIKALYSAYLAGVDPQLPAPPIQYADFAVWQRRQLQGRWLEQELDYWEAQFAGQPTVIELPTDYPRPGVQSMRGAVERIAIPADLADQVRDLCRGTGSTLFMTMLSAFTAMLYRYTGQTSIAVGSGVANRQLRELESVLGMIVNTVVLRLDLAGNPRFTDLIARTRALILDQYEHLDVPVDKLVERLRITRDLSRNPLFQVMFSFHDSPVPSLDLPGVSGSILERSNGSAKADLNIIVIPYAEQRGHRADEPDERRITMIWEYSTDLFGRASILAMIDHFQTVLRAVVADPGQRIDAMPLLSSDQLAARLLSARGASLAEPPTPCLHDMVAAQAERHPELAAVAWGTSRISYGWLNQRSDDLAHHLARCGVGRGDLVGICSERGIDLIVAMLGVLKAGAAYLPLDPAYPPQRIAAIVADSQLGLVLAQRDQGRRLAPATPTIWLDEAWPAASGPLPAVTADDLAYVIYTSGSTGQPKGVACTHRGAANLLADMQHKKPLPAGARYSLWTSINFDVSVYEIFSALAYGGTLWMLPEEQRLDPQLFLGWLADNAIASAYVPPFMVADLATWATQHPARSALRRLLVGVEPISEHTLQAIAAAIPGLQIINGYGPTEAAICATLHTLDADPPIGQITPIGRAVQNSAVYVLDHNLRLVPHGVPGEICIGGIGLARAYHRQPALTAAAFVPDPFSPVPGARMYRTGDRGRCRADGTLEFLGRTDSQVKIRGLRIELGEIHACLIQHPAVREGAVIVRDDQPGQATLVAYIVPSRRPHPTAHELRDFLRERLPAPMIPAAFVLLDRLPLTANDKLDRAALPAPAAPIQAAAAAPLTELERRLAAIWADVLGVPVVSREANFFDLGGHSLLATRIAARIEESLHLRVALRAFFEHVTVAELAAHLEPLAGAGPGSQPAPAGDRPADLLASIDQLSSEELDALFQELNLQG